MKLGLTPDTQENNTDQEAEIRGFQTSEQTTLSGH